MQIFQNSEFLDYGFDLETDQVISFKRGKNPLKKRTVYGINNRNARHVVLRSLAYRLQERGL